jgi:ABC-type transporter Mla MlaB component
MLRISEDRSSVQVTILRLEGQAIGPWVEEVRKTAEQALINNQELVLDLAKVSFADRSAIALFRELINRQVALINCSPLMAEQLKQAASE